MTKTQIRNATLTQKFFNEFTAKAMTSRSDVSTTLTDSISLAFQFKAFDLLEERRIDIYVNEHSRLCVQTAKLEAGKSELTEKREVILAEINFKFVLRDCIEFFEKAESTDSALKRCVYCNQLVSASNENQDFCDSECQVLMSEKEANEAIEKEARQIAEQIEKELNATCFPDKYRQTLQRNLLKSQAQTVALYLGLEIYDEASKHYLSAKSLVNSIFEKTLQNISDKKAKTEIFEHRVSTRSGKIVVYTNVNIAESRSIKKIVDAVHNTRNLFNIQND